MNSGKSVLFYKKFFLLIFFNLLVFNLQAVNFSDLNLSNDDRLLFRADFEGESAVFLSLLTDMSIRQITAFPEKMYLVDNGRTILSINRFGVVKIPITGGLPQALSGYPSFSYGNIPLKGRIQDIAASPDGRWYIYLEPASYGFGNLTLIDISNGAKRVISERVELPGQDFPVKWSPDSRLFVYSKNGRLYFYPIMEDMSVLIDERFRMLGTGAITSVSWGKNSEFYYLAGSTLYRVRNPELFTRTIYGDFLSIGTVLGVLPFDFDPNFDRYWVAPGSSSVLINKNNKSLFFFPLSETGSYSASAVVFPHIQIPYDAENFNVLWPETGAVTVSYSQRNHVSTLRFDVNGAVINTLPGSAVPISPNGTLSPDGTKAVFWGQNGLELWDYTNWRLIYRLSRDPVYSCVWISNRQLLCGNSRFIEEINISSASYPRRRISLSSADEFGFEETERGASRILARAGSEWYASDGGAWTLAANTRIKPVSLSSNRFRVFLEPIMTAHFKNAIMIRNAVSAGTVSFTASHTANSIFSPVRQAKIALCFDLYDDNTGLPQILSSLRRYGVRATFFLNGEFIRRNPQAASMIAEAGHEAASMFYAPIDFSDTRYIITRDFITQGLARNEDEFHKATGRELSIIWHTPHYRNSALINSSAAAAGYITINRSIDPGDWMSREESLRLNLSQSHPAEMIDSIMRQSEAGFIVPVRLGLLSGGRYNYLFQSIDVLLDAMIRRGFEIVPVSSVIR